MLIKVYKFFRIVIKRHQAIGIKQKGKPRKYGAKREGIARRRQSLRQTVARGSFVV